MTRRYRQLLQSRSELSTKQRHAFFTCTSWYHSLPNSSNQSRSVDVEIGSLILINILQLITLKSKYVVDAVVKILTHLIPTMDELIFFFSLYRESQVPLIHRRGNCGRIHVVTWQTYWERRLRMRRKDEHDLPEPKTLLHQLFSSLFTR